MGMNGAKQSPHPAEIFLPRRTGGFVSFFIQKKEKEVKFGSDPLK